MRRKLSIAATKFLVRKPRRALYQGARALRRVLFPSRWDALDYLEVARKILDGSRLVAVDVGAAAGLLPHWRRSLHKLAHIYQIEPRADACRILEEKNRKENVLNSYSVIQAAVAGTTGTRTLYVSNEPTGTSLLPVDVTRSKDYSADYVVGPYFFPLTQEEIETLSLAEVMDGAGEPLVDFIKLDVQGTELECLLGLGAERLDKLLCAELEIGLSGFYPDQATFGEVENRLAEFGLQFFDVRVARTRMRRNGDQSYYAREVFGVFDNSPTLAARAWEFDAVFFRKGSDLIALGDALSVRKLVLAYCVHNFFIEAYHLVEKAEQSGLFDGPCAATLKQCVVDIHRLQMYRWRYAPNWLNAAVFRVGSALAPRSAPRWCQYMWQDYPSG